MESRSTWPNPDAAPGALPPPAVVAPFRQPRNPLPPLEVLANYEPSPLDPAIAEELQAYVERRHKEILPGDSRGNAEMLRSQS